MTKNDEKSDELAAWVRLAQQGDSRALAAIIEATQDRLFKFSLYLCGNHALAQDLCQDTYIKVLERISKIKNPEALLAWLLTSLKNQYLDYLRAAARRDQPLEEDMDLADTTYSLERSDNSLELKQALARLTADERYVILLVDLEGYSYAEAADIQGISENALRSRVFRARQQLQKKVEAGRNESAASNVLVRGAKS